MNHTAGADDSHGRRKIKLEKVEQSLKVQLDCNEALIEGPRCNTSR